MTHDITPTRMEYLSRFSGTIGIEEVGEADTVNLVIRISVSPESASDMYYKLGNMEE